MLAEALPAHHSPSSSARPTLTVSPSGQGEEKPSACPCPHSLSPKPHAQSKAALPEVLLTAPSSSHFLLSAACSRGQHAAVGAVGPSGHLASKPHCCSSLGHGLGARLCLAQCHSLVFWLPPKPPSVWVCPSWALSEGSKRVMWAGVWPEFCCRGALPCPQG